MDLTLYLPDVVALSPGWGKDGKKLWDASTMASNGDKSSIYLPGLKRISHNDHQDKQPPWSTLYTQHYL